MPLTYRTSKFSLQNIFTKLLNLYGRILAVFGQKFNILIDDQIESTIGKPSTSITASIPLDADETPSGMASVTRLTVFI
jgi:hypothetical protein